MITPLYQVRLDDVYNNKGNSIFLSKKFENEYFQIVFKFKPFDDNYVRHPGCDPYIEVLFEDLDRASEFEKEVLALIENYKEATMIKRFVMKDLFEDQESKDFIANFENALEFTFGCDNHYLYDVVLDTEDIFAFL